MNEEDVTMAAGLVLLSALSYWIFFHKGNASVTAPIDVNASIGDTPPQPGPYSGPLWMNDNIRSPSDFSVAWNLEPLGSFDGQ